MFTRDSVVLTAATVLVLSGCWHRQFEHDAAEVSAVYPHKVSTPCASWLRSRTTGFSYCASPAIHVAVPVNMGAGAAPAAGTAEPVDETKIDKASLMAHGETVYGQVCAACHQGNGEGVAGAFPPLAGAGAFYGEPQNHATIIVNGLQGEIVVKGTTFNGVMPPQGNLSDYDIAAAATFERHSWGNDDGIVLPADVKAIR